MSEEPAIGTIRLLVPARPNFLVALRVMARTAAALSAFDVDDIEDMQMAVDEAATLLLPLAADEGASPCLTGTFNIAPAALHAELSVPCATDAEVEHGGMGWLMLSGLDPTVTTRRDAQEMSIAVERDRSV